jgi:hypothetical protein
MNNAGSPDEDVFPNVEFENIKAETFWRLKFDFENNCIKLLDANRLISDLVSLKYEFTTKGKIKIMSKKDMKKEGFKSPDYADSLALANYGTKRRMSVNKEQTAKSKTVVGDIMNTQF